VSSATIYLTGDCNLRCKHCFVGHDQLSKRPALQTAEVAEILRNLRNSGTTTVTLLGGEVTSHRADLPEILSVCDELGLRVSINTNLIDVSILGRVLDSSSLFNVVVSVDGITAASHDKLRGRGSFERTTRNLECLGQHRRVQSREILVDLTFVLNALNQHEVFDLVNFYRKYQFNKLNFKTLQFNDRAEDNRSAIGLSSKELLDRCTAFYFYCVIESNINLDMHIPPAFGMYLNKILYAPEEFWNFNSCGGTKVYTYVDLYGNNLPCPAMSFEENVNSNIKASAPALDAAKNPIAEIRKRSLFLGFDRSVAMKYRNQKMFPCKGCKFSNECSPCTNSIIRGAAEGVVDICASVFEHADARIPGFCAEIFNQDAYTQQKCRDSADDAVTA
jgi:MoaA/NifB/PqqE/SkfB family radical SAM enzyme